MYTVYLDLRSVVSVEALWASSLDQATPSKPPSDPLQTPSRPPPDPLQTPSRPPYAAPGCACALVGCARTSTGTCTAE
eukprot:1185101-Prorocentrum_minimum.AAC.1